MDGACGVGGCRYPLSSLGGGDRLPAGRAFLRRLTSKRGLEDTHYSLLVFGFNRIPIVAWLREQATESLTHAQQAGEMITHLGDYPVAHHRAVARYTPNGRRHHPAGNR